MVNIFGNHEVELLCCEIRRPPPPPPTVKSASPALLQGLIIPGGESTTMALVCERWGLIDELKTFLGAGKPIWGTCAGMIFLASGAQGAKDGGQALLGGLPVTVSRNFFGAQINSFECDLDAPTSLPDSASGPCRAVFIRAPAILEASPDVEVLASYHLTEVTGYGRYY